MATHWPACWTVPFRAAMSMSGTKDTRRWCVWNQPSAIPGADMGPDSMNVALCCDASGSYHAWMAVVSGAVNTHPLTY